MKIDKNKIFIWLSGILTGTTVFLLIYGLFTLDVTRDSWIMLGYENNDIIQHYAGWLGYRNSAISFPIGHIDGMSEGSYAVYADCIPLVAVIFKCLFKLTGYSGIFQYFGWYTLTVYCLQAVTAGFIAGRRTKNKAFIFLTEILFTCSPVMLERSFRHTSLSSHFIILLAIYLYLKCRDNAYSRFPIMMYVLSALCLWISPYFMPFMLCMDVILFIEGVYKTRKVLKWLMYLGVNILLMAAGCVLLGLVGTGVNAEGFGLGLYGINLNSLVNPVSTYDTDWSLVLPKLPLWGLQGEETFEYAGLGILAALLTIIAVWAINKDGRKHLIKNIKAYPVYIIVMIFVTLIAISVNVTFGDKLLFGVKLFPALESLLSIFRSSQRFFWLIYYSMFIYADYMILNAAEYLKEKGLFKKMKNDIPAVIIMALLLVVQLADISDAAHEKGIAPGRVLTEEQLKQVDLSSLTEQFTGYDRMVVIDEQDVYQGRDLAVCAMKAGMHISYTVASRGDTSLTEETKAEEADLLKGITKKGTVYITFDEAKAEAVYEANPGILVEAANLLRYTAYIFFVPA